jgi:hypothetical protein
MQYEEPRAGAVTIKIVSSIYKFRKKMVNIYNKCSKLNTKNYLVGNFCYLVNLVYSSGSCVLSGSPLKYP